MIAEIITIGDELLIGQVINTNASWMASELNLIGVSVRQITCVSDSFEHIFQSIESAFKSSDVIILTGGLGPTNDDITKHTLVTYFGSKLLLHEPTVKVIEEFFRRRNRPMLDVNLKQAEIPDNCIPLFNANGTAPGMWFEKEGKILVSLPGVPFEMKALMTDHVLPLLSAMDNSTVILHKTILTQGVGESFLAEQIADWENGLPQEIKLAYLPQPGIVRLRLSVLGTDKQFLESKIQQAIDQLLAIIPQYVFGFDNDTLESVVGELLHKAGKTIATAESCTGGYLAHMITSVPGSSAYFKGSIIAYSNEVKTNLLGVSPHLLETYGAVSREVAEQMAEGAMNTFGCDYAFATTGIAGPTGGSDDKPVGTVWVALASHKGVKSHLFHFGSNRERNIRLTALSALNMARKQILYDLKQ